MMTPERIHSILESLGGTADEIAESLLIDEFVGRREMVHASPISRYLIAATGASMVLTWITEVRVIPIRWPDVIDVSVPPPIVEFVRRYREGEWPALELEGR